ncbi:hypothetical protein pb186bvf_016876 [Paramecium bursaria]
MDQNISDLVDQKVRKIKDYPKEGVNFRDICPLLKDIDALNQLTEYFASQITFDFDYIAGIESRGFIFGILLSQRLKKGFVPIRKKNKLPGEKFSLEYKLEYGTDTLEIQKDSFAPGSKIIVVDDLIALGGSARAASDLIISAGGQVVGLVFVIELVKLKGREKFQDIPIIVALSD